jgi:hydrogenase expression/formation protein HypC
MLVLNSIEVSMCLAVPGKILSWDSSDPLFPCGRVDFAGIVKKVNLAYVPEANTGDYVLVHAGFAISVVDEAQANEVFEFLQTMDEAQTHHKADVQK